MVYEDKEIIQAACKFKANEYKLNLNSKEMPIERSEKVGKITTFWWKLIEIVRFYDFVWIFI